ncbi:MAG: acyltransferase [Acetobacter sp.]|nr:acyltransferase [Acetobacter sp.]
MSFLKNFQYNSIVLDLLPKGRNASYWRKDIDGLRGIAVLAVVLYHIFPRVLPGGFVGVDIFFVLSGYLVTEQLLEHGYLGWQGLVDFYSRRIVRLTPALVCTLISVLCLGWVTLLPSEFSALGKSIAASAFSLGNILSWFEFGYFDRPSMLKPLLHLWSLGVEEQFYLFWPLCLLLARGCKARIKMIITCLGLVSFALDSYHTFIVALAGFYMPFDRCWEFMPGAILVFSSSCEKAQSLTRQQRNVIGCIGGAGIFLSFLLIRSGSYFPAPTALFPTFATAALLLVGQSAWFNRVVLSMSLLRWLGLISYPLYLWHWPLVAWYHIMYGPTTVHNSSGLMILTISILLAWGTVLFIEKPIRSYANKLIVSTEESFVQKGFQTHSLMQTQKSLHKHLNRKRVTQFLLLSIVLVGGSGWGIREMKGVPGRSFPTGAGEEKGDMHKIILAAGEGIWSITPHMHVIRKDNLTLATLGNAGDPIVLTGDSLLFQWGPRVENLLEQGRLKHTVIFVVGPSCAPLEGSKNDPHFSFCNRLPAWRNRIIQKYHVHKVVIGAFWGNIISRYHGSAESIIKKYTHAIIHLKKMGVTSIWIILPTPVDKRFNPHRLLKRSLFHVDVAKQSLQQGVSVIELKKASQKAQQILRVVANKTGAILLDPFPDICGTGLFCPVMFADEPKYADDEHLRPIFVKENIHFLDTLLTH